MNQKVAVAMLKKTNVEIDIADLSKISSSNRKLRANLVEYTLKSGKRINLLAEGRLVNLAAAEGHPSEVMDMSFANQTLNVEYLIKNKGLEKRVYCVPKQIDELVANLKLKSIGTSIDTLTEKQKKYIATWDEGTI